MPLEGEGSYKRISHLNWKSTEEPGPLHSGLWEDALLYLLKELNLLLEHGDPLCL